MLQKYLVYIVLWFLFQLLIEINCQQTPIEGHTATFIDNKLYILGGFPTGKGFFYINFSVPFNTKKLLLNDLSSINIVPAHRSAGSARGGANNDTLFICGGNNTVNKGVDLVYTFNSQSNSWSIPKITGDPPEFINSEMGTIDHNGIMYFWDMFVFKIVMLDTINLIWKKGSMTPNLVKTYAATLLPDNKIIYIGK
jgi:hypothetical protein